MYYKMTMKQFTIRSELFLLCLITMISYYKNERWIKYEIPFIVSNNTGEKKSLNKILKHAL